MSYDYYTESREKPKMEQLKRKGRNTDPDWSEPFRTSDTGYGHNEIREIVYPKRDRPTEQKGITGIYSILFCPKGWECDLSCVLWSGDQWFYTHLKERVVGQEITCGLLI